MSWLELLARDATTDELESHRRHLIANGRDREAAEREARLALQLQARLHERLKRAQELSALSEMARRLESVRDLDDLLQAVAIQARTLLHAELAYLALREGEELRIRYFDGTMGPALRDIRLSPTAGLAGRIMSTGTAATTSDYLADTTIEHLPHIDSFATDEQLRSILGVPVRVGDSMLGVLFVGERSARVFHPGETGLLSGLAAHAAVAIENAHLFDAQLAVSRELRTANEQLKVAAAVGDRAVQLHERITDAVVRGGGPAEVVHALSEVLRCPVQLLDEQHRTIAGPDLGGAAPARQVAAAARRTADAVNPDGLPLLVCPVVAAEAYLGCLVVPTPTTVEDGDRRLLERGAHSIALALVQQRAVAEAALRNRGELLAALVDGGDPSLLQARGAALRIDLDAAHVVVVVEGEVPGARAACLDLASQHRGLSTERSGRTVLLLPLSADLRGLTAWGTAGVSEPVHGAGEVPEAYATAVRCLQTLLSLDRRRTVAAPPDLGLYRVLLAAGGPDDAAEFVQRTVGPLLEHDQNRGTDLAATAEAYLAHGRQHSSAAAALRIHPNTLYQRLSRIGAVLGEDWREADRALDLQMALRLRRLVTDLETAQG